MSKFNLIKDTVNLVLSHIPNFKKVDFTTILVTEFNWGMNPKGINEEYLNERFEIFNKYTFPSINAQTDKDFYWIIFLNPQTPQKFKDILEEYKKKATMKLILAYVDCTEFRPRVAEIVKKIVKIDTRYVLTCRCDNDDMIAKEYIANMRKNFRPINNLFLDFIYGYSLNHSDNALKIYKRRANHFVGYIEDLSKNDFESVFCVEHPNIGTKGWIRRINNKKYPLWCEIIHETNLVNTFRGEEASQKEKCNFEKSFKYNIQ